MDDQAALLVQSNSCMGRQRFKARQRWCGKSVDGGSSERALEMISGVPLDRPPTPERWCLQGPCHRFLDESRCHRRRESPRAAPATKKGTISDLVGRIRAAPIDELLKASRRDPTGFNVLLPCQANIVCYSPSRYLVAGRADGYSCRAEADTGSRGLRSVLLA